VSGKRVTAFEQRQILDLRAQGHSFEEIRKITGRSKHSVMRVCNALRPGENTVRQAMSRESNPPKTWEKLSDTGKRWLEDFGAFGSEALGLRIAPWWRVAAEEIVALVLDPNEKFGLFNAPTGAGKTTMLESLILWLISGGGSCDPALGRGLRAMFGSATLPKAIRSADRMRRILENPRPLPGAEQSLLSMFGRFKPSPSEGDETSKWKSGEFTVAQVGEEGLWEKDPTLAAYSLGASPLSARVDVAIVDDPALMENVGRESLEESFEKEFESRIEPGGALIVVGQRLAVADLYGALAERTYEDDEGTHHPTYRHLVFPAHFDERCTGDHVQWNGEDTGCLLDAVRLPWSKLRRLQADRTWAAMMQQRPEEGGDGLVPRLWIDGGHDADGNEFIGALDPERAFNEYPWEDRLITYATVDPAITSGMWAVMVWATRNFDSPRYLIDGYRLKMSIDEFLGVNLVSSGLSGLMQRLQMESRQRGHPIKVWVIEGNFGRSFGQPATYGYFEKSHPDVSLLWPTTSKNKTSIVTGVQALLPPLFKAGRMRLPYRGDNERTFVRQFVQELVAFPHGRTTDTVMSAWLGEANIRTVLERGATTYGTPNIPWGQTMPPYLEKEWGVQRERPLPKGHPYGHVMGEIPGWWDDARKDDDESDRVHGLPQGLRREHRIRDPLLLRREGQHGRQSRGCCDSISRTQAVRQRCRAERARVVQPLLDVGEWAAGCVLDERAVEVKTPDVSRYGEAEEDYHRALEHMLPPESELQTALSVVWYKDLTGSVRPRLLAWGKNNEAMIRFAIQFLQHALEESDE
jgi:hypothetical protein